MNEPQPNKFFRGCAIGCGIMIVLYMSALIAVHPWWPRVG